MVYAVLQELLHVSTSADKQEIPHIQLDISSLPDQTIFALQLYHCWSVCIVISYYRFNEVKTLISELILQSCRQTLAH